MDEQLKNACKALRSECIDFADNINDWSELDELDMIEESAGSLLQLAEHVQRNMGIAATPQDNEVMGKLRECYSEEELWALCNQRQRVKATLTDAPMDNNPTAR
jgi:hypothetical protein